MGKVKVTESGCWEWQGYLDKCGYGRTRDMNGKSITSHRLSYLMFKGEIPKGSLIMHSCDNPCCVNPSHLTAGTPLDNAQDRDRKGRAGNHKGEANGRAKLTDKQVSEIRHSTLCTTSLMTSYEVSRSTICRIRVGKLWENVV